MNTLNSIIIEGNMVRDPVLKETPKGTPVCSFSIASNRYYRQDNSKMQETSYFDVESWSKLAKACNDIGNKGRGVRVVGRLKQDRWKGTDGKNYSKIKVIAEHIEFKPQFKANSNNTKQNETDSVDDAKKATDEHKSKKDEVEKLAF